VFDKPDSVTFRSDPVIFAARGYEAAQYLIEYARRLGDTTLVCSVMPAHVAAAYAALTAQERHAPSIVLPVAVPAPAKEGEVRGGGFVHSHWEFI
jgi:hypothetical protein